MLERAASELVRRHSFGLIEGARGHLAGDVSKAFPLLFDLQGLTAAGAVVLQIECGPDLA